MYFKNICVFDKLPLLINVLNNYNKISKPCFNYNFKFEKKFIIGETNYNDNYNVLRIWKSNAFLNYHFENMDCTDNLIGCLDYYINDDKIKIEYLSINDNFSKNYNINKIILQDNDALELKNALIKYLENIAKKNNITKIIIDVHNNLNYYNHYYKDLGFILTNKKCSDNPYWMEAIKNNF